jgi:hypothetical protein
MSRLIAIAALLLASLGVAAAKDCSQPLPAELGAQLAGSYPGLRPLELSDLRTDDQDIWRSAHPKECPGSVSLHFFGAKSADFAVLLVRPEGSDRIAKVVVAQAMPGGHYLLVTVRSEDAVTAYPVIHNGGPGRYEDSASAGRSFRTHRDALIVEHLESAATAYLVHNGEVVSVLLTE